MARGRFISNTLGESDKFAELQSDTHRLMYVLMLTHTDVEGRLKGNATWLAGKVYTYLGYSRGQIEAGLADMDRVGLIRWYEVDGRRYVQVRKFHDHNKVRRDRESASEIPEPPEGAETVSPTNAGGLREDSGSTPSQVEVEVEVEVQEEGQDDHSENRMARAFATGKPQATPQHRVRAELRRLAGPDFVQRHEPFMAAWSRWTNDQLRDLWDASDPSKWPGETHKKRAWILKDLLDEERRPPRAKAEHGEFRSFDDILAEAQRDLGVN